MVADQQPLMVVSLPSFCVKLEIQLTGVRDVFVQSTDDCNVLVHTTFLSYIHIYHSFGGIVEG